MREVGDALPAIMDLAAPVREIVELHHDGGRRRTARRIGFDLRQPRIHRRRQHLSGDFLNQLQIVDVGRAQLAHDGRDGDHDRLRAFGRDRLRHGLSKPPALRLDRHTGPVARNRPALEHLPRRIKEHDAHVDRTWLARRLRPIRERIGRACLRRQRVARQLPAIRGLVVNTQSLFPQRSRRFDRDGHLGLAALERPAGEPVLKVSVHQRKHPGRSRGTRNESKKEDTFHKRGNKFRECPREPTLRPLATTCIFYL